MPALLELDALSISYVSRHGDVRAVREVSLAIERGEAYGLVGESGCGKSTLALGTMGYLGRNGRVDRGRILFRGENLLEKSAEQLRALRGSRISMVYQDPLAALNPCLTVGEQLAEVLMVHRGLRKREAWEACLPTLEQVRMPDPRTLMTRYPHQLSGGQQQRVLIAMALLPRPDLLIMDEPTTGLDVTIEAAVLDLVAELRRELETAILYISHNLGVIARICDRVGVMYAGELVEEAGVREIFRQPLHPYTRGLLRCVPRLDASKSIRRLTSIPGQVPPPTALVSACGFEARCGFARDVCRAARPELSPTAPGHTVRCVRWQDIPPASEDAATPSPAAPGTGPPPRPLLEVEDLRCYYDQAAGALARLLGRRRSVRAVDGVDLQVGPGAIVSVVGESGCGKTTLAKCIAGLVAPTEGRLMLRGLDISRVVEERDPTVLREIQMVFQNPDATLNPSHTVGRSIGRSLQRLGGVPRPRVREEVRRLLREVQLDENLLDRLPRQLSGGQKQRVAIARALAGKSPLVICDEPASALDVSVQAAILNLLIDIQHSRGTAIVFISHDLSVVRYLSDSVAVMYLGQVCEVGRTEEVFAPPYHPYTEALLSAVPVPDPRPQAARIRLEGPVPSALDPPSGCRFHTRCPRKVGAICETTAPPSQAASPTHQIACHIPLSELSRVAPVAGASTG